MRLAILSIAAGIAWMVLSACLKRRVHAMSFRDQETPVGRTLVHTAAFFHAPIHALSIMWASIKGIGREIKRP